MSIAYPERKDQMGVVWPSLTEHNLVYSGFIWQNPTWPNVQQFNVTTDHYILPSDKINLAELNSSQPNLNLTFHITLITAWSTVYRQIKVCVLCVSELNGRQFHTPSIVC